MLPGMRVNTSDDFSSLFFIQDSVSADRSGDLIFFKFRGEGALAIDVHSGKVAWSIDGNKI